MIWIYIFVAFLPTQLGWHYFTPTSFINGVRIDYLAPTIYFIDIIFLLMFFSYFNKLNLHFLKIFLIILTINACLSLSPLISFYKALRLLQWVCVAYIFYSIGRPKLNSIFKLFILNGLLQLALGLAQIAHRGSLQGVFYWLGERYFNLDTPAIAKIVINGVENLRPYGTFSHPNSLAGFYTLIYTTLLLFQREIKQKYFHLGTAVFWLLILFSFSKGAIIAASTVQITFSFIANKDKQRICKFCFWVKLLVPMILAIAFCLGQGDPLAFNKRLFLLISSFEIFQQYWLTGTGIGAYLLAQAQIPHQLPYHFLQPVHNIFILIGLEIGILLAIPLFIKILFLSKQALSKNKLVILPIMAILITGMVDHYWWTLQQNFLLTAVIFGLITRSVHNTS